MTTQIEDKVGAITFDIDNSTIQLVNGRILIWQGLAIAKPDIDMDLKILEKMLSTTRFLIKEI